MFAKFATDLHDRMIIRQKKWNLRRFWQNRVIEVISGALQHVLQKPQQMIGEDDQK